MSETFTTGGPALSLQSCPRLLDSPKGVDLRLAVLKVVIAVVFSTNALAQSVVFAESCSGNPFAIEAFGAKAVGISQPKVMVDSATVLGPFKLPPPEIQAIRRGAFSEFIGGHINDGISYWTGVDLETREVISISRKVWDKRAKQSRDFGFPDPPSLPNGVVLRKWVAEDGSRKELETVRKTPLSEIEVKAFVCMANGEWAAKSVPAKSGTSTHFSFVTDSLSSVMVLRKLELGDSGLQEQKEIDKDGVTGYLINVFLSKHQANWKY